MKQKWVITIDKVYRWWWWSIYNIIALSYFFILGENVIMGREREREREVGWLSCMLLHWQRWTPAVSSFHQSFEWKEEIVKRVVQCLVLIPSESILVKYATLPLPNLYLVHFSYADARRIIAKSYKFWREGFFTWSKRKKWLAAWW